MGVSIRNKLRFQKAFKATTRAVVKTFTPMTEYKFNNISLDYKHIPMQRIHKVSILTKPSQHEDSIPLINVYYHGYFRAYEFEYLESATNEVMEIVISDLIEYKESEKAKLRKHIHEFIEGSKKG